MEAHVHYALQLSDDAADDQLLDMNALIGRQVSLEFTGTISCLHCGRKTRKSFNQGFCYPCFTRLPQSDSCIVKPELCHFHNGTCRDAAWGERNCFAPHIVYLANSSGLKVGITRAQQVPTRWMDQGAVQAVPILKVKNRLHSGLVERLIAEHVADKTNWRAMLKNDVPELDLTVERDRLLTELAEPLNQLRHELGDDSISELAESPIAIEYPVTQYPTKITSFNFDKTPLVSGTLMGIKGQYLMFDTGVNNLRKYGGYNVRINAA